MITVSNYNAGGAYSSGGSSSSGISSLQEGPGINIQNPNGPTSTIANAGVISLEAGTGIAVNDNIDGSWTVSQIPMCPLQISDASHTNELILECYTTDGQFNPFVTEGGSMVAATNTDGNGLVLTVESDICSGMAIYPETILLGYGGTGDDPLHRIELTNESLNMEGFQEVFIEGASKITLSGYTEVEKKLTMTSASASERAIDCSTYNMIDRQGAFNTNTGSIYSDTADFYYDCNGLGKSHIFLNNDSAGNQITSLALSTSYLTINTSNLPTAPLAVLPAITDSSSKIPTTAWIQNLLATSYNVSTLLNGDGETYTVPSTVRFIDIMIQGKGGKAGIINTAGGINYYGGSGSGGTMCFASKFFVQNGQQFQLDIASNGDVLLKFYRDPNSPTTYETIATVVAGGDGEPGDPSDGSAAGGLCPNPTLVSTYCTWSYIKGTAGSIGTTSPPTTAGYPKSRYFNAGTAGCGQVTPSGAFSNGNIIIVAYS